MNEEALEVCALELGDSVVSPYLYLPPVNVCLVT